MNRDLLPEFCQMSQIKSTFDTEKFTVGKEANFVASQFHFLMRQYRFALEQQANWECEQQEAIAREKTLTRRSTCLWYKVWVWFAKTFGLSLTDISTEIKKLETRLYALEIDMAGKRRVIEDFERMRQLLLKHNGKPFTNEQYQAEQPSYYQWFIAHQMYIETIEHNTGIRAGTVQAALQCAREPIDPNSAMKIESPFVNGCLDLQYIQENAFLPCDNMRFLGQNQQGIPCHAQQLIP